MFEVWFYDFLIFFFTNFAICGLLTWLKLLYSPTIYANIDFVQTILLIEIGIIYLWFSAVAKCAKQVNNRSKKRNVRKNNFRRWWIGNGYFCVFHAKSNNESTRYKFNWKRNMHTNSVRKRTIRLNGLKTTTKIKQQLNEISKKNSKQRFFFYFIM